MKLLVVGGGGREHALAWRLARSNHEVWCAPGNAGIRDVAECVDMSADDVPGLADWAERNRMDLTLVGPEVPLVAGIAGEFARRGLALFGPSAQGARIEGDKAFTKQLMRDAGIPTAAFETFTEHERARACVVTHELPVVIKASGLAAGKGAVICRTHEEAEATLHEMMVEGRFGVAGRTVVIEQFLTGEEASIIGLCDGETVVMMVPTQDHKALEDGDQGPNTGGMGAYAPAPVTDPAAVAQIEQLVFQPLIRGLKRAGIEYRGVVYAGMMLTADGPQVLEFNCRFGDPETQPIMCLLESDLAELALACAEGRLGDIQPRWSGRSALCVVLASGGYPGKYRKGLPISGNLAEGEDTVVFHAGTRFDNGQVVTAGGRVLGVTGLGDDLGLARDRAYAAVREISFDDLYYRRDIGHRGIERLES